jgi:hypothetical protein
MCASGSQQQGEFLWVEVCRADAQHRRLVAVFGEAHGTCGLLAASRRVSAVRSHRSLAVLAVAHGASVGEPKRQSTSQCYPSSIDGACYGSQHARMCWLLAANGSRQSVLQP